MLCAGGARGGPVGDPGADQGLPRGHRQAAQGQTRGVGATFTRYYPPPSSDGRLFLGRYEKWYTKLVKDGRAPAPHESRSPSRQFFQAWSCELKAPPSPGMRVIALASRDITNEAKAMGESALTKQSR